MNTFIKIDEKYNRVIVARNVASIPAAQMLTSLLKNIGEVKNENGKNKVQIIVSSLDGIIHVEVDGSLDYEGYMNYFSGRLTAKAASHALTTFLNNHFAICLWESGNEFCEILFERHYKLIKAASEELKESEYSEYHRFLD